MKLLKKFITNKYFLYFIGIILFVLIWFLISLFIKDNTMIFPTPFQTIKEVFYILKTKYIYISLLSTLSKMFIGFSIALFFALIIGSISGCNKYIKDILKPIIVTFKAIPTASLLFLFLVLSGAYNAPIYIVILICFPILYESVVGGIENIDKSIIDAAKLESGNSLRMLFKIKLPLSIPYIMVGITSSFGLAFKIQIMAEILTGNTKSGIGALILSAQRNDPSNMVPIFAYSLIAIVCIFIIDIITISLKNIVNKKSIS